MFFDDSVDHHLYKQSWRRKTAFELLTLFALFLLVGAMLVLMLLYPVLRYGVLGTWVTAHHGGAKDLGWNIGGINSSGQVPKINIPPLVDPDTPQESRTRVGFDGDTYNLVFSDEVSRFSVSQKINHIADLRVPVTQFNLDGRTFWPGDDPYWEAVDVSSLSSFRNSCFLHFGSDLPLLVIASLPGYSRLRMVRPRCSHHKGWQSPDHAFARIDTRAQLPERNDSILEQVMLSGRYYRGFDVGSRRSGRHGVLVSSKKDLSSSFILS